MPNPKTITIKLRKSQAYLTGAIVIAACLALGFFYVRAAFIEPTFAPGDSNQDFAQNILGANNANNLFLSDAVTGNNDGSIIERLEYFTDYMATRDRDDYTYGRGWVASSSGDASVALTHRACEEADGWVWFEDANGDGDTIDAEDGICVATSTVTSANWGGHETNDNTYIAEYTCSGSFPNGVVVPGATYPPDGVCALCTADCYDGRKDLPDQGSYTTPQTGATGYYGPITEEVLKNWKGTRLPTFNDFFGFCGHATGTADDAAGDSYYYSSGASADKTLGYYGHNAGRGASGAPHDKYINLSRTSYEWLSERSYNSRAQVGGSHACSYVSISYVSGNFRFRAVFRP